MPFSSSHVCTLKIRPFVKHLTVLCGTLKMAASDIALDPPCLCPWDNRRLPREMYVKLFVVHFVVIGAFGHLQHLRRERRGPFIYLLMIMCPLAGAALVLVPRIALVAQAIIYRGDREILKNSAAILIGKISSAESELGRDHSLFHVPKISTKFFWAFVMQLVPFVQSILSLWLYLRRIKHDSAALYDDRIAQLAILGLSASLMSLIHSLSNPQCPSTLPSSTKGPHWKWIAILRPTVNVTRAYTGTYTLRRPFTVLVTEWGFAFLTELIIGRRHGITHKMILATVWYRRVVPSVLTIYDMYYPSLAILVLAMFSIVLFLEYLPRLSLRSYTQMAKAAALFGISLFSSVFLLPPGTVLLVTLGLDFLNIPLQSGHTLILLMQKPWQSESYAGAVYNPVDTFYDPSDPSKPLNLYPDWRMIWTYGHTPPSFPCPKAWKDPAADYVWWLA